MAASFIVDSCVVTSGSSLATCLSYKNVEAGS